MNVLQLNPGFLSMNLLNERPDLSLLRRRYYNSIGAVGAVEKVHAIKLFLILLPTVF